MTDAQALAQAQALWGIYGGAMRSKDWHIVGVVLVFRDADKIGKDSDVMPGGRGLSWEEAFDDAYENMRQATYDLPITFDIVEEFRRSLAAMVDSGMMSVLPLPAPRDQQDAAEYSRREHHLDVRWSRLVRRYEHKHAGGVAVVRGLDYAMCQDQAVADIVGAGTGHISIDLKHAVTIGSTDGPVVIRDRRPSTRIVEDELREIMSPEQQKELHSLSMDRIVSIVPVEDGRSPHVTIPIPPDGFRAGLVGDERRPKGSE